MTDGPIYTQQEEDTSLLFFHKCGHTYVVNFRVPITTFPKRLVQPSNDGVTTDCIANCSVFYPLYLPWIAWVLRSTHLSLLGQNLPISLLPAFVDFSALVNFIKIDQQTTTMGYGMKSLLIQALGSHHNSFYNSSDVPLSLQDLLAPYLPTLGVSISISNNMIANMFILTENFNNSVGSAIHCPMLQFSTHSSSSQSFGLASIVQLVVSVLFLFFSIGRFVRWFSMRHNACTITRRMPSRCLSEIMTTKQLLFILLSLSVMTVSGRSPYEVILY